MKPVTKRKLALSTTTIKNLSADSLTGVAGGYFRRRFGGGFRRMADTKAACSVGTCLKDRYTNCH